MALKLVSDWRLPSRELREKLRETAGLNKKTDGVLNTAEGASFFQLDFFLSQYLPALMIVSKSAVTGIWGKCIHLTASTLKARQRHLGSFTRGNI